MKPYNEKENILHDIIDTGCNSTEKANDFARLKKQPSFKDETKTIKIKINKFFKLNWRKKNMKIGVKITLLSVSAIIGIAIIFAMSYIAISNLDNMFTYIGETPVKNSVLANDIYNDINTIARQTAMVCFDPKNPQRRIDLLEKTAARMRATLVELDNNVRSEGAKQLASELDEAIERMEANRQKFEDFIQIGKIAAAQELRIYAYSVSINEVEDVARRMVAFMETQIDEACFTTSAELSKTATIQLVIIGLVVGIAMTVFSVFIITGITRPLRRAVNAANDVSNGNLNVDLSTNAKDETGTLMHSLESMVNSVGNLIKDTEQLSTAAINGKLEVRADANKHQGAFKELIEGINKTLDAVIGPLNMTAEYVDRISKGDMPPKITDTYNGDFNEIKNNLNGCMDAITLLVKEINLSITKAIDGDFTYKADVTKFHGDFRKIMEGVNELVGTFVEPLEVASEFLQGISVGNEGIQKITKEYKGEFNVIKDSVNKVHDVLFTVLEGIVTAAAEAEKGNLDVKADTSKVQGAWILIMNSLNAITAAANAIITDAGATLSTMATGDLTPRIKQDYPGKFGEMKDNINYLGDSLTDLISHLTESIHTTATASAQISATAETIAAATQEQSSQTEEVASSVEQMSRTVTDNAHSATKTSDVAKKSGEVANNGGKVVQQTVAKMREISSVVKSSAANIAKLGESSKKIGEIIGVIDDIADQTNLLSLNAAIEAARAGEQGRGFAVVADSVGKLAISTASATKEIADMIKGIQTDTDAAVKAMEKGTSEVQNGIELADSAGNSIQNILSGITELLDMVNQIAAASEEQSATSEQISKNVTSISKVTAESARNIEDVAATANELAKMTETLTSLVSQFKINSTSNGRSNGHTNGRTNGHSNGYANGYSNGRTNGYNNGNSNGHSSRSSNGTAHSPSDDYYYPSAATSSRHLN